MYTLRKNKTLYDMLTDDPTLFNGLVVPSGMTASVVVQIITDLSGPLCPYIQDAARLKSDVTAWSTYRAPDWARALTAMTENYDPLHNYKREELGSEEIAKHKGTKVSTNEDVSDTPATITSKGSVVAYDANTESETGQSVTSPGATSNHRQALAGANYTTYEDVSASVYDKDVHTFVNRITQGNVGVTKSQEMARDEVNLRFEVALYERIAAEFENKFMIQVY